MAAAGTTAQSTRTPLFGQDHEEQSDGSVIIHNLFNADILAADFYNIAKEVKWDVMLHKNGEVPRLVCCQGDRSADHSTPLYRHPADETILASDWTPTVDRIRRTVEEEIGHKLNHALIQLYRNSDDFISEHSDKTLDIVPGSKIVNLSLGAERIMRLRSKRSIGSDGGSTARTIHRVRMPHSSMIVMSLATNAKYLHGINADKRSSVERTASELAFQGQRISITFRQIGTFMSSDGHSIWGQGAISKCKEEAGSALSNDRAESDKLLLAFAKENQSSTISWDECYGCGSNVLHLGRRIDHSS